MNEKEKENYGKIFNKYSNISENFIENIIKDDKSPKIVKPKINEDQKTFGDFVLMMNNEEDYKKIILENAKKKVWKAIDKIKNKKDLDELIKDPSSTKWYIINPDQNKYKVIFDSFFLCYYM